MNEGEADAELTRLIRRRQETHPVPAEPPLSALERFRYRHVLDDTPEPPLGRHHEDEPSPAQRTHAKAATRVRVRPSAASSVVSEAVVRRMRGHVCRIDRPGTPP